MRRATTGDELCAARLSAGASGVLLVCVVAWSVLRYPEERLDRAPITSTRILDRHGALIYEARSQRGGYGRWAGLDDIAPALVQATLCGEDARFLQHLGIDPQGVARAIWLDLRAGRAAYGGSTLTQQLAKLLDPQPRDLGGKLLEGLDALRLEATLTKREILEQYLNRAYYGRQATGVEAAARRFFDKSAASLTLGEAALLAVLPRAPSAYDPQRHPERARRRRAHVLARMVQRGWVGAAEAGRAARSPIRLVDPRQEPEARHLLDHLMSHGIIPAGRPELRTTLDLELQRRLEGRVRMHLRQVGERAVSQAGVVVLDNATGGVLAMVGSRRYEEAGVQGAVNATTARRQPGSALKPFVYALAIERGDHPSTPIEDGDTTFRDYRPRAAHGRHHGRVSYREALGSSLNEPAVRLARAQGIDRLARLLHDAGVAEIDPEGHHGLGLALGSSPVQLVHLAEAYATLARGGVHLPTRYTLGRGGAPHAGPRRVLSAQTAYLVTDMLGDGDARSREFGLESPLDFPFEVAAKTGTSQSFCDNVAVGYTRQVTVAVWVGNFDGRPMHGVLAMSGAAPLFHDAMLAAMEGRDRTGFPRPEGIEEVEICPLSGMIRGAACPHGRRELVASSHRPRGPCPRHGDEQARFVPEVAIRVPADGSTLRIDPLLRAEEQQALLRAEVSAPRGARLRWEIDGRPVAHTSAPFRHSWAPTPGVHRIRAVLDSGGREIADEIYVVVE